MKPRRSNRGNKGDEAGRKKNKKAENEWKENPALEERIEEGTRNMMEVMMNEKEAILPVVGKDNKTQTTEKEKITSQQEDEINPTIVSGMTSNTTLSSRQRLKELPHNAQARWKTNKKNYEYAIKNNAWKNWINIYKFSSTTIAQHIVLSALDNDEIKKTSGMSKMQFVSLTSTVVPRVFNTLRHNIESAMRRAYESKCEGRGVV